MTLRRQVAVRGPARGDRRNVRPKRPRPRQAGRHERRQPPTALKPRTGQAAMTAIEQPTGAETVWMDCPVTEAIEGRTDQVMALGYTRPHARFLLLVVGHANGLFLSRQFLRLIDRRRGGAMTSFLTRLRVRGHVMEYPHRGLGRLYHVNHPAVIRAAGLPADRVWRLPDPVTIGERLLALDYLVDHANGQAVYADRATWKVALLKERWGMQDGWPTRIGRLSSTRGIAYPFPDRWPVGVGGDGVLELVYGTVLPTATAETFRAFLLRHVHLLTRIVPARIVYLYPAAHDPRAAVQRFEEVQVDPDGTLAATVRDLVDYADLARRLLVPGAARPGPADLERFAELQQRFGDGRYDGVIAACRESRVAALRALRQVDDRPLCAPLVRVRLDLVPCAQDYFVTESRGLTDR